MSLKTDVNNPYDNRNTKIVRKELSIEICKHIINTELKYKNTQWINFINEKRKKDGIADLADCFLQGLWYISNFSTKL